jgi:hypothetical protein
MAISHDYYIVVSGPVRYLYALDEPDTVPDRALMVVGEFVDEFRAGGIEGGPLCRD